MNLDAPELTIEASTSDWAEPGAVQLRLLNPPAGGLRSRMPHIFEQLDQGSYALRLPFSRQKSWLGTALGSSLGVNVTRRPIPEETLEAGRRWLEREGRHWPEGRLADQSPVPEHIDDLLWPILLRRLRLAKDKLPLCPGLAVATLVSTLEPEALVALLRKCQQLGWANAPCIAACMFGHAPSATSEFPHEMGFGARRAYEAMRDGQSPEMLALHLTRWFASLQHESALELRSEARQHELGVLEERKQAAADRELLERTRRWLLAVTHKSIPILRAIKLGAEPGGEAKEALPEEQLDRAERQIIAMLRESFAVVARDRSARFLRNDLVRRLDAATRLPGLLGPGRVRHIDTVLTELAVRDELRRHPAPSPLRQPSAQQAANLEGFMRTLGDQSMADFLRSLQDLGAPPST